MSVDVLVTASIVYTGDRVIRDGYVYMKGGRVVDVGESPVPEEYTYATLILGGEGRIVAPGLAAYIDAPAYPIRGLKPRLADRASFYERLDPETLLVLSLPAVYEAHMAGVTTVVVESPSASVAVDLSGRIGGYYTAAVPSCLKGASGESVVGGDGCPASGASLVLEGGQVKARTGRVLGAAAALNYRAAITSSPDVYRDSLRLREALGIPGGRITKGARAELVVFDSRRPPGMLADLYDLSLDDVYRLGAPVESLIAGDDVLVDGGEHLRITSRHFGEVRKFASRLLSRSR